MTKNRYWLGRKLSTEHKEKLRQAKLKNPVRYWKGKERPSPSKETLDKMIKSARRGELNHKWKGGISKTNENFRKTRKYKAWKLLVKDRDKKCVLCGSEKDLQVDHIAPFALYPELRLVLENGRLLCANCHRNTDTYGVRPKK